MDGRSSGYPLWPWSQPACTANRFTTSSKTASPPLHRAAGDCAATEAGAGTQKRDRGLPVDRATVATGTAERQLHPGAPAAPVARPQPAADAGGGGLGSQPQQEQLSGLAVSATGRTPGEEAGPGGG